MSLRRDNIIWGWGTCNMAEDADVLRRLEKIEGRLDQIDRVINEQGKTDAVMDSEFKALRNEFASLKSEVVITIKDHTERTWELMHKCFRVIMVLISIIVAFAGIKLGPDIIQALLGMG